MNIKITQMDNIVFMKSLPPNSIDLIYCDILYGTGKDFMDFKDLYPMKEIIYDHYEPRIKEMHRILKQTGSIYLQMDYRIIHWVRCIMDDVFGYSNFINEIIWKYNTGNQSGNAFHRKHDNILFYSKGRNYTFNSIEEEEYLGTKKPSFGGRKLTQKKDGYYRYNLMPDVWNISQVFTLGSEYVKYATQKPKKLIERIVKVSSNEGDLVADFYLGSGTTAVVCKELKRNFIGCDINENAISITESRLNVNDLPNAFKKSEGSVGKKNLLF